MPDLQRLRADYGQAVLAFELANRDCFALSISDRGEGFYRHFTQWHAALLAEQAAGINAFTCSSKDATASLGYRVAEHVAGRGMATAAVREVCRLAVAQHGLRALTAATFSGNGASQRVLIKAGFVPVGPADPADIGGKQGTLYRRNLAAE